VNIPQTGVNEQKVKFFKEIANAFEFLSVYHSLAADKQLELMQHITLLQSKKEK
jgi:hypothetical protein